MFENEGENIQKKKGNFRVTKFSRRQFLKRTGIAAIGAAIASLTFSAACKSSTDTTAGTTTEITPTTTPATSGPQSSTSTVPSSITTAPTSVVPPASSTTPAFTTTAPVTTTPAATTPPATEFVYVPPSVAPPLVPIAGTSCMVATDRLYSADNMWIKSVTSNVMVIGLTTTMIEIIYEPYILSLPSVGNFIKLGDVFGATQGYKMTSDLISPVSGTVVQINKYLTDPVGRGAFIMPLNDDPYNAGWMMVVQLSKPDEVKSLLTYQAYADLVSK